MDGFMARKQAVDKKMRNEALLGIIIIVVAFIGMLAAMYVWG
jgi:flagellar basal body-associated protein FliL